MPAGLFRRRMRTALAFADPAEIFVGVDPGTVAVGPGELERVASDRLDPPQLVCARHDDREKRGTLVGVAVRLAGGARAVLPEGGHGVPPLVAVVPLDPE